MKLLNKHPSRQQTESMKDAAFVKCLNEGHSPVTPLASHVCSMGFDYSGNEIFGALSLVLQKHMKPGRDVGERCCPSVCFVWHVKARQIKGDA